MMIVKSAGTGLTRGVSTNCTPSNTLRSVARCSEVSKWKSNLRSAVWSCSTNDASSTNVCCFWHFSIHFEQTTCFTQLSAARNLMVLCAESATKCVHSVTCFRSVITRPPRVSTVFVYFLSVSSENPVNKIHGKFSSHLISSVVFLQRAVDFLCGDLVSGLILTRFAARGESSRDCDSLRLLVLWCVVSCESCLRFGSPSTCCSAALFEFTLLLCRVLRFFGVCNSMGRSGSALDSLFLLRCPLVLRASVWWGSTLEGLFSFVDSALYGVRLI